MESAVRTCFLLFLFFSSQQLSAQGAADKDKSYFYQREAALLKKIFSDYDPAKAAREFKKNNGQVFYMNYIPTFLDFSELHLSGEAKLLLNVIWKDYAIKSWSPDELSGRRFLTVVKPKGFWRPPSPMEMYAFDSQKDNGLLYIRNDGYVYFASDARSKFHCQVISSLIRKNKKTQLKTYYPNEKIACFRRRARKMYQKWNYSCKKWFHDFFHSLNKSMAEYPNCTWKSYRKRLIRKQRYNWLQTLKGWRIQYIDRYQGLVIFVRSYSYNYIVDVLSCTAMAFLTVTQFFVPLSISQRVLVTFFGCLIAVANMDVISALDNILQRGSPRLTAIALSLLTIQVLALLWTVLGNNLQQREELRISAAVGERFSSVIGWLKKLEAYRIDTNRMQRLVEEPDGTMGTKEAADTDQVTTICTGPLLIRAVDCVFALLSALTITVIFSVYLN